MIVTVNQSTFIDMEAVWQSVGHLPHDQKARGLMARAGVAFHDPDTMRYVRSPVVALAGIGGLPFTIRDDRVHLAGLPVDPRTIASQTSRMMGFSGFMSYLNPNNRSAEIMAETLVDHHRHFSIAHSVSINLMIFGISTACELELVNQRDLLHFSRFTVARTSAQNDPAFVVQNPDHIDLFRRVHEAAQDERRKTARGDDLEEINRAFSASKASMIMASGTLRNFQKVLKDVDDTGKEAEYRRILRNIKSTLYGIWPGIFT